MVNAEIEAAPTPQSQAPQVHYDRKTPTVFIAIVDCDQRWLFAFREGRRWRSRSGSNVSVDLTIGSCSWMTRRPEAMRLDHSWRQWSRRRKASWIDGQR